ncbi:hypothetical protein KIS4809_1263 [Bacillus sp. ZZV12-4809]|nr:hypothetical protein KIS4809_1263 [Bacillus sp. ZZV12-4809]
MILISVIFLSYAVYVNATPGINDFTLLTVIGIIGVILSLISTYQKAQWLSFIFTALPLNLPFLSILSRIRIHSLRLLYSLQLLYISFVLLKQDGTEKIK